MREAWLLMRGVEGDNWSHQLQKGPQKIGRSVDCEIHLQHPTVSRFHAEITKNGALFIRDLNSLNGTFVDSVRISESVVTFGMEVRIGQVALTIVSDPNVELEQTLDPLDPESTAGVGSMVVMRQPHLCAHLTATQRQVLKCLLQGLSEKMVASALSVSRQTVHTHVKEIYRLMNVHSRPELMALFISATVDEIPDFI